MLTAEADPFFSALCSHGQALACFMVDVRLPASFNCFCIEAQRSPTFLNY